MNTTDWNNFCEATKRFPEGTVGISREIQVRLRDWAVESGLIAPGVVGPVDFYAAVMAQFLGAGCNLQREKTAEEIAAEAAEAKLAEARRNAGRLFTDDEPAKPTCVINEFATRDALAQHNARVDSAFENKRNPNLTQRERMDNLLARMDPANIPGLVDESFAGCSVYTNGRVNHYKTQQAQEAAKQRNAEVRARYAEQQAAAEVAASQKKGI